MGYEQSSRKYAEECCQCQQDDESRVNTLQFQSLQGPDKKEQKGRKNVKGKNRCCKAEVQEELVI
jgi:hypothetical protein